MNFIKLILFIIIIDVVGFGLYRQFKRQYYYQESFKQSKKIKKPLLVIGDPYSGSGSRILGAYGCGDLCTDLNGCSKCENSEKGDILHILKKKDKSFVIFESCLLEYLDDKKTISRKRN